MYAINLFLSYQSSLLLEKINKPFLLDLHINIGSCYEMPVKYLNFIHDVGS